MDFLQLLDGDRLVLVINTRVYSLVAIFRTCYIFTNRCYLYLSPEGDSEIKIQIKAKTVGTDLNQVGGDFCNELINQEVRQNLAKETGKIRELIVAQAFAEGNLLDDTKESGSFQSDPRAIGRQK